MSPASREGCLTPIPACIRRPPVQGNPPGEWDGGGVVVFGLLATTLSPADARMAARFPEIADHATKPLTLDWLNILLQKYFS